MVLAFHRSDIRDIGYLRRGGGQYYTYAFELHGNQDAGLASFVSSISLPAPLPVPCPSGQQLSPALGPTSLDPVFSCLLECSVVE